MRRTWSDWFNQTYIIPHFIFLEYVHLSGNVLFLLVMQASQIHSMIRIYTLLIHTPRFVLLEYVHLLSGTCCPCWLCIDWSCSFNETDIHPASYFCTTHTCSPHLSTCICQVRLLSCWLHGLVKLVSWDRYPALSYWSTYTCQVRAFLLVMVISQILLMRQIYSASSHPTGVHTLVRFVCSCWLWWLAKFI